MSLSVGALESERQRNYGSVHNVVVMAVAPHQPHSLMCQLSRSKLSHLPLSAVALVVVASKQVKCDLCAGLLSLASLVETTTRTTKMHKWMPVCEAINYGGNGGESDARDRAGKLYMPA